MKLQKLKEAGYPQTEDYWYSPDGIECYSQSDLDEVRYVSAPLYMEVWLWLWRKKNIAVETFIGLVSDTFWTACSCWHDFDDTFTDPEEAIIAAIDYLFENEIIK